jgi:hypothetical protein
MKHTYLPLSDGTWVVANVITAREAALTDRA